MNSLLKKAGNRVFAGGRRILYYVFRFDPWHVSPLSERAYARDIIKYLNAKPDSERGTLVEIGCGLGDIVRRVRFREVLGLDCDANALRAASFLAGLSFRRRIAFRRFQFPQTPLAGRFDAILMVNWIHNVPPDVLKENISRYFHDHLTSRGEILIDTVGAKTYTYNHRVDALTEGLACCVEMLGEYENLRRIYAIRKGTERP
jgi:cyclopropane fatty-acyl-phospholipid synthase-like methyltransferase